MKKIKITIVGSGYVGMSLAIFLAQKNEVTVLDIDPCRVKTINNRESTIQDDHIEGFFVEKELNLNATIDTYQAYKEANFIIIATPTNYCVENNCFDTSSVDSVVNDAISVNKEALVVITSTLPIGHTNSLRTKMMTDRIVFSPEFLREGKALQDNLHPSRIILGGHCKKAQQFAKLMTLAAEKEDIPVLFMGSSEAEAVKLFANTYLAMRVAFFNELDSYAMLSELDTRSIINGISLYSRIGGDYNNPSLGYGGYCLPKDTKQLLANYHNVPQKLIEAIVLSNDVRKQLLSKELLREQPRTVGFYRLVMKAGSDNFRSAAVIDIIQNVKASGVEVIIYEPSFGERYFMEAEVIQDLAEFKSRSNLIVANRSSGDLVDVDDKVFTRDVFGDN